MPSAATARVKPVSPGLLTFGEGGVTPELVPGSRKGVRAVLDRVTNEVAALPEDSLRKLAPVLREAEREVASDLARWLRTVEDGEERFTAQRYRSLLLQLRHGRQEIEWAQRVRIGTFDALRHGGKDAGSMAMRHLTEEVARFSAAFGGPAPIDLERAGVLAKGDRLLIPRFKSSAARYAGNILDDIKRQFSIGVVRQESFWEMTNRLQRLGRRRLVRVAKGEIGEAGEVGNNIAAGLFTRYRYWGERVVRTEMINAYNQNADDGLVEMAKDDPRMLKRWDASLDYRCCIICRKLHGETVKPHENFSGGNPHPPAHCNCRCAEVAWMEHWKM